MMMMWSRVVLVLAAAIGIASGQPILEDSSTWELYRKDNNPGTRIAKLDTKVLDANASPRTIRLRIEVVSDNLGTVPMIRGIALRLAAPQIFCDSNTPDPTCIVPPTRGNADDYPVPSWYFTQGARTLYMSFNNPTTNTDVNFCHVSVMKEWCRSRETCDALNWNQNIFEQQLTAAGGDSDLNAVQGRKKYTVENLVKTRELSGRNRAYGVKFDLLIDNDFLRQDEPDDDTYSLQLTTGERVYFTYALYYSSSTQEDCSAADHREIFTALPDASTVVPWDAEQRDEFRNPLVTLDTTPEPTPAPSVKIVEPTRQPTNEPTSRPSRTPSRAPTGRPSRAPTMKPSRNPSPAPTGRPSRAPSPRPTKAPTTPTPSRSPTMRPTGRPSKSPTPRPSRQPTVSPTKRPTDAPLPQGCPNERNWELCTRINTWYSHISDPQRRMRNILRSCTEHNCYFCNYEPGVNNCRPRQPNNGGAYTFETVCPADQSDPFELDPQCEQFSVCPTPEEMTACLEINRLPGPRYKKDMCESAFTATVNGVEVRIGKERCAYNNGICRAVGDYYWARKTVTNLPGFFDKTQGCEYAEPFVPLN